MDGVVKIPGDFFAPSRDAGEQAIGAKVELAGKVTLVLVSLPLFERLLRVAGSLLSLG